MPPVPQPAKGELAMRRVTNRRVAELYGCHVLYVGRVLNGIQPPSPRFRAFLSTYLNLPEDKLFRDSADDLVSGAL